MILDIIDQGLYWYTILNDWQCSISAYERIVWSAPFLTPYKMWGNSRFVRYFWNLLSKKLSKCEII